MKQYRILVGPALLGLSVTINAATLASGNIYGGTAQAIAACTSLTLAISP